MLKSLNTRICMLIGLVLILVAVPVLYFTHRDGVRAMSETKQRSVRNVLELTELNMRSGYRNLLYSRVDAVLAHRRTLEGMVLVAQKGLDAIFASADAQTGFSEDIQDRALEWVNRLESVDATEFLIFDSNGLLLAHPNARIRYRDMNLVKDIKGMPLARTVSEEARKLGKSSTTFFLDSGDDGQVHKKYGWFVHYPAMNWIIGAIADIEGLEREGARKKAELLDNLQDHLKNVRIAQSGSVVVFDGEGTMLIQPEHEALNLTAILPETGDTLLAELQALAVSRSREPVSLSLPDAAGQLRQREIYCTHIKILGWYVATLAYVDEIRAPAQQLVQRLSLIIATLFLVSLMLGLWLAIRMTRPLNALASFAIALPEADFTSPHSACAPIAHLPKRHRDEVGRLAGALIFMEKTLRDNIRALIETTARNERMAGELNVAREIQLGLLPKTFPPFPDHGNFDLYASLEPAREVGGDLYDFFFLDDTHFCFAIGDVSGKGVPASLFMAISRTLLRTAAAREKDPALIMTSMNNDLASNNPNSMFVTLFIGVLNLRTGHLVYANGGHNPPVLLPAQKAPVFLKPLSGPIVGAMEGLPYTLHETRLDVGDALFLYTDGVTEAMDSSLTVYSDPRLLDVLTRLQGETPKTILQAVEQDVARHVGEAEASDDITMLCLCFKVREES